MVCRSISYRLRKVCAGHNHSCHAINVSTSHRLLLSVRPNLNARRGSASFCYIEALDRFVDDRVLRCGRCLPCSLSRRKEDTMSWVGSPRMDVGERFYHQRIAHTRFRSPTICTAGLIMITSSSRCSWRKNDAGIKGPALLQANWEVE